MGEGMPHGMGDELEPALREIERALGRLSTPTARPDFRARLAERFCDRDVVEPAPSPEALLGRWSVPPARAEFRARLRAAFVGAAGGARSAPLTRAIRRRPALRPLLIAAAASTAILVPFLQLGSGAPTWRAVEFEESARIELNGRVVPLRDEKTIDRLLRDGPCSVRVPDCQAHLLLRADVLLRYDAGSESGFRHAGGERGRELLEIDLSRGSIGVSMGERFEGVVRIITPRFEVEVEGRAVSVEIFDHGWCICSLEGSAKVWDREGREHSVGSGQTFYFAADGSDPELKELVHGDHVEALRAVALGHLKDGD